MADGQWSPGRVSPGVPEFRPVLDVVEPARQRRLTVLLRFLLLLPHYVFLFLLLGLASSVTWSTAPYGDEPSDPYRLHR